MRTSMYWSKALALSVMLVGVVMGLPAAGQFGSITIDDQPTAEQKLAEINDLRRAGRYDDAAELIQELVDGSRFKLVGTAEKRYIDAEFWVRREMTRDGELARAYRERYTAEAEREAGEAIAARDQVALREAYRRFGLTAPGLEAGLVLAGLLLESGEPTAAYAITEELLEHPDLAEYREQVLSLHGASAALMGDGQLVDDLARRLTEAGHEGSAEQLRSLAARVLQPVSGWSRPVVDAGPRPESISVPLWSEPMARRGVDLAEVRRRIDELRIVPVASRDLVYVNTGQQLLAMDRAAGPVLWSFPEGDPSELDDPIRSRRARWSDTRAVAISGGRVIGVLGECYGLSGNGRDDVPPNRLVCVDASSGTELWSRVAGELQEGEPTLFDERRGDRVNLLQTHFVGTPLIAEGQALVMLRRANQQGLMTTWLLSFDVETGKLRWVRHLALAQVQNSGSSLVFPQLTLAGNTVYLTDSIGVAAAIDARSGAYKWLTVLAEDRDFRRSQIVLQTDGVITPPVMTRSGLVVCLAATEQRLTLLDPADGTVLSDMDVNPELVGVEYIMDVDGDVLIVTKSKVALWDGEQAEVRWSTPLEDRPRGRGDVSRDFAVVPTANGSSYVINLQDGKVIEQVEGLSGNVVVLEEEILVSSGGQLHSYMSWQRAYDRLVRRIEQRPNDPDAGLALASLALRQGEHRDAVMQGVEYAMQAVDRLTGSQAQAAGQRVFDRLRGLAGETREADNDLRRRLYDQLALASRSAEQEVAYHLDFGQYLVQVDQPQLAVEHFQAVMVDPAFSSQAYLIDGGQQPAGNIAQQELVALVKAHGRSVYARFDALAWQRLERLRESPDATPADFSLIAQRYPLAEAASPALLAAAAILREQGEPFGELSYCQQAVARAINPQQLNEALGAMLAVQLRSADRQDARLVIEWVSRQFPDARPVLDGEATDLSAWLTQAQTLPQGDKPRPTIPDDLDTTLVLDGRLVQPAPGQATMPDPRYLYLHDGERLRQVALTPGPAEQWSVPLKSRQLYLIADDRGQLLLWDVYESQIIALDARTGEAVWQRPADLSMVSGADVGGDNLPVRGDEILFSRDMPRVIVSPTMICVADQNGMVVGIDRYLGTPLWRVRTGMVGVRSLAFDGWVVAIAGLTGPDERLNHGRVVVLDMLTGEQRLDPIDLHVGFAPNFVAMDRGRVVVVGGPSAGAYSLDHGGELWSMRVGDDEATGRCALAGDLLAVEDADGIIHVFDVSVEPRPIGRLPLGHALPFNRQVLQSETLFEVSEKGIWFASPLAMGRIGLEQGGLLWRDAMADTSVNRYGLAVGANKLVAVTSPVDGPNPDRLEPADRAITYDLHVYDAAGGLLLDSYQIGPLMGQPDPRQMRIVEGGLVMPMGPQTLLLRSGTAAPGEGQPQ